MLGLVGRDEVVNAAQSVVMLSAEARRLGCSYDNDIREY
jgi:hypothetical protein